jgi:hypothetical protein
VVNQTADLINKSFQKSLSNPLDLQLAGFGKGAGTLLSSVTTLAGTAFTTMNLFNSISYGIGGGGGGGNTQDTFGGNNTSITTNTTGVNDLINSPKTKDTILKTPLDQLSTVKKSLIELIKADDLFLTIVLAEKTNLEGVRSCYSNVLESRPDLANDSRITSALSIPYIPNGSPICFSYEGLRKSIISSTATPLFCKSVRVSGWIFLRSKASCMCEEVYTFSFTYTFPYFPA